MAEQRCLLCGKVISEGKDCYEIRKGYIAQGSFLPASDDTEAGYTHIRELKQALEARRSTT